MVTDMNGRIVARQAIEAAESRAGKLSLDINNFASGLYIVRVINDNGAYVARFIVK